MRRRGGPQVKKERRGLCDSSLGTEWLPMAFRKDRHRETAPFPFHSCPHRLRAEERTPPPSPPPDRRTTQFGKPGSVCG